MKFLYDEHDMLQAHLDALRKLVTILNYPESMAHEVRRGWPELQLLLRGIDGYFRNALPRHHLDEEQSVFPRLAPLLSAEEKLLMRELELEHRGLETLAGYFVSLTEGWSMLPHPPSRNDIARLSSLASEITLHFERHTRNENERLLPLIAALLPAAERRRIAEECRSRAHELPKRKAG